MANRKQLTIPVLILVVFLVLLMGARSKQERKLNHSSLQSGALAYAVRGPHWVGTRDLVMEGGTPLELTIWYPAMNGNNLQEAITYAYRVKMGSPIGIASIASFAGQAIYNAPYDLSQGPYPLVILSPGFSIGSSAYAWLAEHLASYGFVVVSPDHREHLDPENELWRAAVTRPQDIISVLAFIHQQVESGGDLEGLVNPDVVAVAGHSYGGYTALAAGGAQIDTAGLEAYCGRVAEQDGSSAWLCNMLMPHLADMAHLAGLDSVPEGLWPAWADPRVDVIVPLAGDAFFFGQAGLAEVAVPVLAIGGTADSDLPYQWNTYPTYEYTASPRKVRIALNEAEHMIFTGPCEAIPLHAKLFSGEFCADTDWDRLNAHDLVRPFTTAFLLSELHQQDPAAAAGLAPDAVNIPDITYDAAGYSWKYQILCCQQYPQQYPGICPTIPCC